MTSAPPINPKNATSATNISVARVSLMVLRLDRDRSHGRLHTGRRHFWIDWLG